MQGRNERNASKTTGIELCACVVRICARSCDTQRIACLVWTQSHPHQLLPPSHARAPTHREGLGVRREEVGVLAERPRPDLDQEVWGVGFGEQREVAVGCEAPKLVVLRQPQKHRADNTRQRRK
eukprot:506154-Rhodomonas_salina.2